MANKKVQILTIISREAKVLSGGVKNAGIKSVTYMLRVTLHVLASSSTVWTVNQACDPLICTS